MASIGLQPQPEAGPSRSPRRSLTPSPLPNIIPLVAAEQSSLGLAQTSGGDVEMEGTKEDRSGLGMVNGGSPRSGSGSLRVGNVEMISSTTTRDIPIDPILQATIQPSPSTSIPPPIHDMPITVQPTEGAVPKVTLVPPDPHRPDAIATGLPLASIAPTLDIDPNPVSPAVNLDPAPEAGPSQPKTKTKRKRATPARPAASDAHAASSTVARNDQPRHFMGVDNQIIRCICHVTEDDGLTMQCERCYAWQHASCFGFIDVDESDLPDSWFCDICEPRPLPVDSATARHRQLDGRERRLLEARYEEMASKGQPALQPQLPPPTTEKKRGPKPKRPRTGSAAEEADPVLKVEKDARDAKEKEQSPGTSAMGPPKTRRKPGVKPRARPPTAESTPAPTLPPPPPPVVPAPEVEDDYFSVEPWLLEYTPINENVVRGPGARRIMTRLYREWVDQEAMNKHTTSGPSGLPSPTETGVTRSTPDLFTSNDFSILAPPVPVVLDRLDLPGTYIQAVSEPVSFLPLSYSEAVPLAGPYTAPAAYALYVDGDLEAGTFLGQYKAEVMDCETYRNDPINQYSNMGLPKPYVRPVGPPVNLILDARGYGNNLRYIRSGCHPNAVLRPILHKGKVLFGVFASRDMVRDEEIILGWEWDDSHIVHSLRSHICPSILASNEPGRPSFPGASSSGQLPSASALSALVEKFDTVLTCLMGTFTSCACPVAGNCALAQMKSLVELEANAHEPNGLGAAGGIQGLLRNAAGRRGQRADMGPLVGAVRGWRRREVEMAKVRAWNDPRKVTAGLGVNVWGKKVRSAFSSPVVRTRELDGMGVDTADTADLDLDQVADTSDGRQQRFRKEVDTTAESSPVEPPTKLARTHADEDDDMVNDEDVKDHIVTPSSRARSVSPARHTAQSEPSEEEDDENLGKGAEDEDVDMDAPIRSRKHRDSSVLTDPSPSPSPSPESVTRKAQLPTSPISSRSRSTPSSPSPARPKHRRISNTSASASPAKRILATKETLSSVDQEEREGDDGDEAMTERADTPAPISTALNGITRRVDKENDGDLSDATTATEARSIDESDVESEMSSDVESPIKPRQTPGRTIRAVESSTDSSISDSQTGSDSDSSSGSGSDSGSDSSSASSAISRRSASVNRNARSFKSPLRAGKKPTSTASSVESRDKAKVLVNGKNGVKGVVSRGKSQTSSPAPSSKGKMPPGKTGPVKVVKVADGKDRKAMAKTGRARRIMSSPVSDEDEGSSSANAASEAPRSKPNSNKSAQTSVKSIAAEARTVVSRRRSSPLSSPELSPPPPALSERKGSVSSIKVEDKTPVVAAPEQSTAVAAVDAIKSEDHDMDADRVATPPLPEIASDRVATPPLPATAPGPEPAPKPEEVAPPPPPKEKTPPPPEPAKKVSLSEYLKNRKVRKDATATATATVTEEAGVDASSVAQPSTTAAAPAVATPQAAASEADFIASVTATHEATPTRPPFSYTGSSAPLASTPGPAAGAAATANKGGFDMSSFLPSSFSTPSLAPANGLQLSTPTPGAALSTSSSFVPRTEYFPMQPHANQVNGNGEMPTPSPAQRPTTSSSFQPRATSSSSYAPRMSLEAESVTPTGNASGGLGYGQPTMATPTQGTACLPSANYVPRSTSGSNLAAAAVGSQSSTPAFLTPALTTTSLPAENERDFRARANSSHSTQSPGAVSYHGGISRDIGLRRPSFTYSPEKIERSLPGSGYGSDRERDMRDYNNERDRRWEHGGMSVEDQSRDRSMDMDERDRLPVPSSTGSTTSALPPALVHRDAPPHSQAQAPGAVPPPSRNNFAHAPSAPRASLSPVDRTTNLPRVPPTGPKVPPSGPRGAWSATLEAAGASDAARTDLDGRDGGSSGAGVGAGAGAGAGAVASGRARELSGASNGSAGSAGTGVVRPVPVPLGGMRGGFRGGFEGGRGGWRGRGGFGGRGRGGW